MIDQKHVEPSDFYCYGDQQLNIFWLFYGHYSSIDLDKTLTTKGFLSDIQKIILVKQK